MSSGSGGGGGGDRTYPMNDNGGGNWIGVVVTLILSLLIAVTLVILLYLTAWCLLRRSTARHRSRINQLINEATIMRSDPYEPSSNSGVNQSVIDSLPVFAYKELTNNQQNYKNGGSRECPVCLSLFQDEEMVRLLPNCKHFFHVDCINAWLRSNITCPICRCSTTTNTTTTTTQFPAPLSAEPPLARLHEMVPVVVVVPSHLLDHPARFFNS